MCQTNSLTVTQRKRLHSPHQPVGRWIRPVKRLAIYLRDGYCCVYCSRNLCGADPREVNLDHVVSRVDGGTNHESNLVTTCRACNCSRQDQPVGKFCTAEVRLTIRRLTSRSLTRYLTLAKTTI
jgi:5-methylcytosine-specific restriction endonuclease McrA